MQSWPSPRLPVLPGVAVPLRLWNSVSRSVQPTEPDQEATLYVCGITPYDATHLGHAATYIAFDLVQRVWRDNRLDVHYVQNVTDIDDPLLDRANRDRVDWRALAASQIELYRTDMTALRVLPPRDLVGAVEAMPEIIKAVLALMDAGVAYRIGDPEYPDVYYDVNTAADFGYESGYDRATMLALAAERGGDPARSGKRDPLDPLLWRMERPREPAWDSPMGPGRPGWHIECAAIAGNRLGTTIDLQGGGSDLIFPHHEYSAAHAEALSGNTPFATHYTHAGMVGLDGEKMSKSRGNLVFVSRLLADGVDPSAIRLALISTHYREDRMWSADLLSVATDRLARWRAAAGRFGFDTTEVVAKVRNALGNDLDTPKAIRVLDQWAANNTLNGADVAAAVDALLGVDLRPAHR